MNNSLLKDKVILVTRPAHQAAGMLELLEQQGAKPLAFPSIEISPVELDEQLKQKLSLLNTCDLLIFISANAVRHTVLQLQKLNLSIDVIKSEIAVIGKATQAAAQQAGFKVTMSMEKGFNSEALLESPMFQASQINRKKIVIIRGVGGLEQLADTLQQRGAKVVYAELYRRHQPKRDNGVKRQQLSQSWSQLHINAVTVTSNESLQNLYDMLEAPGRDAMLKTPLIVPSQRCLQLAQSMGFQMVAIAESASNEHILDALTHITIKLQ